MVHRTRRMLLCLVVTTRALNFMLAAKNSNIETKDLIFTPSNVTDSTVTLTAVAGEGKTLTLNYTLGKDYLLNMSLQAT